jgi:tRNA 2-thiouridine synthesizing protein A
MKIVQSVDARQLACPMPLLKAKQAIRSLEKGECVEIWATDSGSWRDFHQFVDLCGHRLIVAEQKQSEYHYVIEK